MQKIEIDKNNMLTKKSPHEMVVQWLMTWLFNMNVKSSSPHNCNLVYLGYLGGLASQPRWVN
jgi:hypothetical protein